MKGNISIGAVTYINGVRIVTDVSSKVQIGEWCAIGYNVSIIADYHDVNKASRPEESRIGPQKEQWPCLFTASDTTGEKDYEEFFTENELLDLDRFQNIGVIKNETVYNSELLNHFKMIVEKMKQKGNWTKKNCIFIL